MKKRTVLVASITAFSQGQVSSHTIGGWISISGFPAFRNLIRRWMYFA